MIGRVLGFYRVREWYYHVGLGVLGVLFVGGGEQFLPRAGLGIAAGVFGLAQGYAFNRLCDSDPRSWSAKGWAGLLLPLVLCAVLIAVWYPAAGFLLGMIVVFNALYSFPSFNAKRSTWASAVIHVFLFGGIFCLSGAIAKGACTASLLVMGAFLGGFLVPAQLLHELAHARADGRWELCQGRSRLYLWVVACSVMALAAAAFPLAQYLSLPPLFPAAGVLWVWFLVPFLRSRIWKEYSAEYAEELRARFREAGMLFGVVYAVAFLQYSLSIAR